LNLPVTHAVISLLGEVSLLLWGVRMVHSGVVRAFGGSVRHWLARTLRRRASAMLGGMAVTLILQSSTATALMATSFVADGVIGLVPAMAVVLGANVGTALVACLLSFDISWLYPMLLFAGLVLFRRSTRTRIRNLGRVSMGLGLMLLALHLLVETLTPGLATPAAREFLATVTQEPLMALLLAALLTWAMHSSIAAVLLVAPLAQADLVGIVPALAMVLGANLGSALNPLLDRVAQAPSALRLPVGNLANRLAGCVLVVPLLPVVASHLGAVPGGPGAEVVAFHLAFNVSLAALFILPLPWVARLLERALPERPDPEDPASPRYLDPASARTPAVALANAARETLRMADIVEAMLEGARELLRRDDPRLAMQLRRLDDGLDRLHGELQRFLGTFASAPMNEAERARLRWILATAVNLEHAGDIIDKGLLSLAGKRIRRRLRFTSRELADTDRMHEHLLAQLRLAVAVFMAQDLEAARRLVEEKERFRELERSAAEAQFVRLVEGRRGPETGGLLLDVVRDLKRVEAHLAAIAHPLLEQSNLLRPSRLMSRC
jgi:phosphate:Na+ symporter